MTSAPGSAEVWRAALIGIRSDELKHTYVGSLRSSKANAGALRDEAAREYEYVTRALESLDAKAGVALAGALALLTIARSVDGNGALRWTAGIIAGVAGVFASMALAPDKVRAMSARVMAEKYGTVSSATFLLHVAAQYSDAAASALLPMKVKVLRLRLALVLLFVAAVLLGLR